MRIAVIFPGSIYSAWGVSDALGRTLRAMGHEVLDLPQQREGKPNWWDCINEINHFELLVWSGPEHMCQPDIPKFREVAGKITIPKFAVYHESMIRPDRNFPFLELLDFFDANFYPAIQDAERMELKAPGRCHWMPFGADLSVFCPTPCPFCKGRGGKQGIVTGPAGQVMGMELCEKCHGGGLDLNMKTIPIGFIGLMYAKRKNFMDKLQEVYDIPVPLIAGNVVVQDIDGIHPWMTALRLAWNYNRIMVFVNLPSLSQLLVTKVVETMACSCCLVTPKLEGQGAANMKQFKHGEHLLYYREDPAELHALLKGVIKNPEMAIKIGQNAAKYVRDKHSLRERMEFMLSKFSVPEKKLEVTLV